MKKLAIIILLILLASLVCSIEIDYRQEEANFSRKMDNLKSFLYEPDSGSDARQRLDTLKEEYSSLMAALEQNDSDTALEKYDLIYNELEALSDEGYLDLDDADIKRIIGTWIPTTISKIIVQSPGGETEATVTYNGDGDLGGNGEDGEGKEAKPPGISDLALPIAIVLLVVILIALVYSYIKRKKAMYSLLIVFSFLLIFPSIYAEQAGRFNYIRICADPACTAGNVYSEYTYYPTVDPADRIGNWVKVVDFDDPSDPTSLPLYFQAEVENTSPDESAINSGRVSVYLIREDNPTDPPGDPQTFFTTSCNWGKSLLPLNKGEKYSYTAANECRVTHIYQDDTYSIPVRFYGIGSQTWLDGVIMKLKITNSNPAPSPKIIMERDPALTPDSYRVGSYIDIDHKLTSLRWANKSEAEIVRWYTVLTPGSWNKLMYPEWGIPRVSEHGDITKLMAGDTMLLYEHDTLKLLMPGECYTADKQYTYKGTDPSWPAGMTISRHDNQSGTITGTGDCVGIRECAPMVEIKKLHTDLTHYFPGDLFTVTFGFDTTCSDIDFDSSFPLLLDLHFYRLGGADKVAEATQTIKLTEEMGPFSKDQPYELKLPIQISFENVVGVEKMRAVLKYQDDKYKDPPGVINCPAAGPNPAGDSYMECNDYWVTCKGGADPDCFAAFDAAAISVDFPRFIDFADPDDEHIFAIAGEEIRVDVKYFNPYVEDPGKGIGPDMDFEISGYGPSTVLMKEEGENFSESPIVNIDAATGPEGPGEKTGQVKITAPSTGGVHYYTISSTSTVTGAEDSIEIELEVDAPKLGLELKCIECTVALGNDASVEITVTNDSTIPADVDFSIDFADADLSGAPTGVNDLIGSQTILLTVPASTISAAGGGGTLKVTATIGTQTKEARATISTVRTVSFPEVPLGYTPLFALLIALAVLAIIKFRK